MLKNRKMSATNVFYTENGGTKYEYMYVFNRVYVVEHVLWIVYLVQF